MSRIGWGELIIILVVVLILFGAKRLPEIAASLRDAIKEFRKVGKDIQDDFKDDTKENDTKTK